MTKYARLTLLMLVIAELVSSPLSAAFLNNSIGLAEPSKVVTLSEIVLAPNTEIGSTYSGFGITFSVGVRYDPSTAQGKPYPNFGPHFAGNFGDYGQPIATTFSIFFGKNISSAAFALATQDGATTIFEALLNGVVTESASQITTYTTSQNYFGFTGISFNEIRITEIPGTPDENGSATFDNIQIGGCQVNACGNGVSDNCVTVSGTGIGDTEIFATLVPPSGMTLQAAAQACGFDQGFNFVQTVTADPYPLTSALSGKVLKVPYQDPPNGGYLREPWTFGQYPAGKYPFYYSANELAAGFVPLGSPNQAPYSGSPLLCSPGQGGPIIGGGPVAFPCIPVETPAYLTFWDAPAESKLRPPQFLAFQTELVGVSSQPVSPSSGTPCSGSSQYLCTSLFTFTWIDDFNGTVLGDSVRSVLLPVDPSSGTGGVTITSINGVPVVAPHAVLIAVNVDTDFNSLTPSPATFNIDSEGAMHVAILGSTNYDVTTIDPRTVKFGPKGAANVRPPFFQDVNNDGKPDLILSFVPKDAGFGCSDTVAALTGQTFGMQPFSGSEIVHTTHTLPFPLGVCPP